MKIMFCGTDNIMQNIPHIKSESENSLQNIVSPQNIVMGLNNVMVLCTSFYNNEVLVFKV